MHERIGIVGEQGTGRAQDPGPQLAQLGGELGVVELGQRRQRGIELIGGLLVCHPIRQRASHFDALHGAGKGKPIDRVGQWIMRAPALIAALTFALYSRRLVPTLALLSSSLLAIALVTATCLAIAARVPAGLRFTRWAVNLVVWTGCALWAT